MFEEIQKVEFTMEMKKDYTILVPSMLPIHFQLIVPILRDSGYHIEIAGGDTRQIVEEGLADVHNDICYPCLLVMPCVQLFIPDAQSTQEYWISASSCDIPELFQSGKEQRISVYRSYAGKGRRGAFIRRFADVDL